MIFFLENFLEKLNEKVFQKRHFFLTNKKNFFIHLSRFWFLQEGLKGNQVEILNSPAAVSFTQRFKYHIATVFNGKALDREQVRRPAKIRGFKGFRGKSRERRYSKYTYIPFLIISHLKPR